MQSVYTVAQINSYIKNMFVQDYLLSSVSVKGEVSNCKYYDTSGHIYFTLKDKLSMISCVMFAGNRRGLSFSLKEGMQVVVSGRIDAYERDGKYQLYATRITQDGMGELYERFMALKQELEERGMFAPEYKQPIPVDCKVLGVVTAPNGAAIRDIISIAKTRNPYIQIVVYPAIVQGERAAASIVKGIKALTEYGVDTMIVGRGGGSLEDLWAFNEEIVAQAIFDCPIPIISAVGHETDVSISDYVADFRAETPSAAAQKAVTEIARFDQIIGGYEQRLELIMSQRIERARLQTENRLNRLMMLSPRHRLDEHRMFALRCEDKLRNRMRSILDGKRKELAIAAAGLEGVSPLAKLSQGFSFTEDRDGRCISRVDKVNPGDDIKIYVSDGSIDARVNNVTKGIVS